MDRYARQVSVPAIGAAGQAAIRAGACRVDGDDLAAEVCARYLAGAGVGVLHVSPALAKDLSALNREVELVPDASPGDLALAVGEARWGGAEREDPISAGARAARWALARLINEGKRP